MTDAELEAKLAPLASPDAAARKAAVTALAALGPDAEAAVLRKLASFRKIDDTALYDPVRAGRASDPGGDDLAQSLASYGHLDHASGLRALTIAASLSAPPRTSRPPRRSARWPPGSDRRATSTVPTSPAA